MVARPKRMLREILRSKKALLLHGPEGEDDGTLRPLFMRPFFRKLQYLRTAHAIIHCAIEDLVRTRSTLLASQMIPMGGIDEDIARIACAWNDADHIAGLYVRNAGVR